MSLDPNFYQEVPLPKLPGHGKGYRRVFSRMMGNLSNVLVGLLGPYGLRVSVRQRNKMKINTGGRIQIDGASSSKVGKFWEVPVDQDGKFVISFQAFPYRPISGKSSRMMVMAAGPTNTTKMAGKMNSTRGKISFTAVLAAFSSAN